MTWDDDGDGVTTVGGADSTAGLAVADLVGDMAIADGRTKGDAPQSLPDLLLERSAFGSEGQRELLALSGKVFLELLTGLAVDAIGLRRLCHSGYGELTKANSLEMGRVRDDGQWTDGTSDDAILGTCGGVNLLALEGLGLFGCFLLRRERGLRHSVSIGKWRHSPATA